MADTTNSFEFWTNIGIGIATAVSGIIMGIAFIKKKYEAMKIKMQQTKDHEEVIDVRSVLELKHNHIHEMLTSLRLQMHADRAQIGQFHNGGKFLEGSPMKRFSVSYESCKPGISMEYPFLQGVLATLFWDMIELLKEDDAKIRFTRSLQEETALRTYNESKNIEAFALLPIKKQELYVGFIRIEWNDISNLPDDPEDANRLMEQYRSFIELEILRRG